MPLTDRRFRKTEIAIYNAFFDLIRTKRYNKITVQDILEKADIGRTTFYSHYQTKDDLFGAIITNIMGSFTSLSSDDKNIIPIAQILEHLKENQAVIKGLLLSDNSNMIIKQIREYWSEKLIGKFSYKAEELSIPVDLFVNHIITSFIELIKWWIENNMPETPIKMEEYWIKLITPYL